MGPAPPMHTVLLETRGVMAPGAKVHVATPRLGLRPPSLSIVLVIYKHVTWITRSTGSNRRTIFAFNIILIAILKPRLHDTAGCQIGCTTGLTTGCIVYTNITRLSNRVDNRFDNRLYRVNGALDIWISASRNLNVSFQNSCCNQSINM